MEGPCNIRLIKIRYTIRRIAALINEPRPSPSVIPFYYLFLRVSLYRGYAYMSIPGVSIGQVEKNLASGTRYINSRST